MNKFLFFLLLPFLIQQCDETIKGNGNITEVDHGVFTPNKIIVDDVLKVICNPMNLENSQAVIVKTDENLQDYIEINDNNKELTIKVKDGLRLETKQMEIHIGTLPELTIINQSHQWYMQKDQNTMI